MWVRSSAGYGKLICSLQTFDSCQAPACTSPPLQLSLDTHQVFRCAQSLQTIQGQEVSRVLVCELGGLLQTPLLVQDGFIPDCYLSFFRLAHCLRLLKPVLSDAVHGSTETVTSQRQQKRRNPSKEHKALVLFKVLSSKINL